MWICVCDRLTSKMTQISAIQAIISLFILQVGCTNGNIKDILKDYNTLTKTDIHHVVTRRDAEGLLDKVVSFNTLGRNFLLHLTPNEGLFSENFKAVAVGSDTSEGILVDKLSFYKGYVEGEEKSLVSAHLQDGMMTASIATPNETYVIEPSWRHLDHTHQDEMIAYRHSDVKFNFTTGNTKDGQKKFNFCGHTSPPNQHHGDEQNHDHDTFRSRRATTPTKLRCPLVLVADYRFFEKMGQSSKANTVNYMIGIIDRVDIIYKQTTWSVGYGNYGFEIEEIKVHEVPTKTSGMQRHYNEKKGLWNIKKLLEVFSYQSNWKKYCLAHLFTYQDFDEGVIGLAYVGNSRRTAVGGICTEDYRTGGRTLYLNTGLSSSVNWGRRVLTEEADIVTAHEFGHNFGSEHDPDNDECAPSERSGGKFIMYPASVSGQRSNNKLFSPCSKRQITEVLRLKSKYCFTEPREKICGNYKKESGEECDPGNLGTIASACCTKDCKLKEKAECSDGYDSPCCKNCKYATGTVCRRADANFCQAKTTCRANNANCPDADPLPDNTTCIERGKCRSGKCVEFCVSEGMEPCLCTTTEYACRVCCKKINSTKCSPWKNATSGELITMLDGRPCTSGSCRKGKCEKTSQDAVEKFWTFLTNLDVNAFVEFMRANIVGTIMFFSLCIWIPAGCIINKIDKRNEKAEVQEQEWRDPKNTKLIRDPVHKTSKGEYIYRQDSFARPSQPMRPLKLKPVYVRTRQKPARLDVVNVNETNI